MKNIFSKLGALLTKAFSRINIAMLLTSCVGIAIAYLAGVYVTGSFHSVSRWLGALLSCTSLVIVLQAGNFHDSLRSAYMRIVGTFIGAFIGYIYLVSFHFSLFGMLCAVFLLEMLCMMIGIYAKSRIATITLIIILLITQIEPNMNPLTNCALRLFESVVGVGVGVALLWVIERWGELRKALLHAETNGHYASVDMDNMPLRLGHLRVIAIASLGQFTGGALASLIGIVLPMYQMVAHSTLSALWQGVVASMSLVGIMVGSLVIGAWSDRYGYLRFFRLCPLIILLGAMVAVATNNIYGLAIGLFTMGFGIGGGYTLDSDYISEIMPRRLRLTAVGVAKATSALGNITATVVGFCLLDLARSAEMWNRLLLLIALIALITILSRIRFSESPGWLMAHGRRDEAERAVRYFLGQDVFIRGELEQRDASTESKKNEWRHLLSRQNLPRVVLSGVPWACEGFGVYGVGVFMPILLMALGLSRGADGTIEHLTSAVEMSVYVNLFVVAGFVIGLSIVKNANHITQQTRGFIVAALGLSLMWVGYIHHLPKWLLVVGFITYELFLNGGPHLVTYILPPQIYPIAERGAGTGLAAAFGKVGGIVGVMLVPILLKWGGISLVLGVTIALQLAGGVVTWIFGRKILPRHSS